MIDPFDTGVSRGLDKDGNMILRNTTARPAIGAGPHPFVNASAMDAGDPRHLGGASESVNDGSGWFHATHCSDASYDVKSLRGEIADRLIKIIAIRYSMFSRWVSQALESSGVSQAQLSRGMTEKLRRQIDRAAVNKIIKGKRELAADELYAISEITKVPIPDFNGVVLAAFQESPASDSGAPDNARIPAQTRELLVTFAAELFRAARNGPLAVATDDEFRQMAKEFLRPFEEHLAWQSLLAKQIPEPRSLSVNHTFPLEHVREKDLK